VAKLIKNHLISALCRDIFHGYAKIQNFISTFVLPFYEVFMIRKIIKAEQITALDKFIRLYDNIVITCHLSPDGDALGASLGLMFLLRTLGKSVRIVVPDMIPRALQFLPDSKSLVVYSKFAELGNRIIEKAELIFCLDFNIPKRIDNLAPAIVNAKAKKVLIDHHPDPEEFCDITISHPEASSTCELIFRVITDLGLFDKVNRQCAECLCAGIMTDTGNLSYNANNPELYEMVAALIRKGVDKNQLYNLVINTSSADRLRLMGYALSNKMELFPEVGAALITLTHEELQEHNYKKGDTESLVNIPLSVPGIYWSVFMRVDPDYVKISMRSQGDFDVNRICVDYFNGGGHLNAAGGEFYAPLENAVALFHKIIDSLRQQ
jgi:phosphoesterase RecJ-like protein